MTRGFKQSFKVIEIELKGKQKINEESELGVANLFFKENQ